MITYQTEGVEMPAIKKRETTAWIKAVAETYGKKVGEIAYIFCSDENLNNVVYNLRKYFAKDASIHLETIRGEGFKMWIEDYSA